MGNAGFLFYANRMPHQNTITRFYLLFFYYLSIDFGRSDRRETKGDTRTRLRGLGEREGIRYGENRTGGRFCDDSADFSRPNDGNAFGGGWGGVVGGRASEKEKSREWDGFKVSTSLHRLVKSVNLN